MGGLAADDHGAAIVLQRGGNDLGRRGAEFADENDHRAVVADVGVVILKHLLALTAVDDLHHRALLDEEAGQFYCFRQQPSAIPAQVEYHSVDLFLAKPVENQTDVAGAILVKLGQVDHTQARHVRIVDDLSLGQTVGEFDLVANEADLLGFTLVGGICRDDGEAHHRAFLATNFVDHLVEFHFVNIHRFAVLTLCHRHDAVAWFEFFAADRRAAGHEFDQLRVAVVPLEACTDAGQRELDVVDLKIFRLARAEVVGVRIVSV